jgi:hypothetical protein
MVLKASRVSLQADDGITEEQRFRSAPVMLTIALGQWRAYLIIDK